MPIRQSSLGLQAICIANKILTKCIIKLYTLKYTVFQKKTPTHIIGYKLRNSCLILIIFGSKIPHIG